MCIAHIHIRHQQEIIITINLVICIQAKAHRQERIRKRIGIIPQTALNRPLLLSVENMAIVSYTMDMKEILGMLLIVLLTADGFTGLPVVQEHKRR